MSNDIKKSFFFRIPFWLILGLLPFFLFIPGIMAVQGSDLQSEKEKIKTFLKTLESRETGLYQSYTNTAHNIEDAHSSPIIFMPTVAGYLDDQAFTYDQALAILVLIHAGEYDKARYLLSVFTDNFMTEKNGHLGLLNSYTLSNFDYFIPTRSGKRRLLCMGIDGDRIHVGPNMWIGLGFLQYYAHTGSPEFLPCALEMFKWTRSLNHYEMPDGTPGGVSMGYGWGTQWNHVFSTENNISYYVFILNLIKIYEGSSRNIRDIYLSCGVDIQELRKEKKYIHNWLIHVGYNKRGTFNRGANLYDDPDTVEALDCTSWAIAAFGPKSLEKMGIDILKLIEKSEKKFLVSDTFNGKVFKGFDFTDQNGYIEKRQHGIIWFEGTGHMALAYRILSDYYAKKNEKELARAFDKKYRFFLNEMERFMSVAAADLYGLPCTSREVEQDKIAYSFSDWCPIVRTEKGKYSLSLSSTIWYYFAVTGFNPFDISMPSKEMDLVETSCEEEIPLDKDVQKKFQI